MLHRVSLFLCRRLLKVLDFLSRNFIRLRVYVYSASVNGTVRFVRQGSGGLVIDGDPSLLSVGDSSHFKSDTYLDVRGGLEVGSYFHTGRSLTIFTSDHNWRSGDWLPYDKGRILDKVTIGDYVWLGANVTVLPGTTIEDAVVVGAGSVVKGKLLRGGVYVGCPAKRVDERDNERVIDLVERGRVW